MILGLDMGGTNIDVVIINNKTIVKTIKKTIDYNDVFKSIYDSIFEITKEIDKNKIKKINLSTTISTNKIALNDLDKVGLIIQTGPGLNYDFLNLSNYQEFIKGYTDHRGVIVKDFDLNEINLIKDKFKREGITNIGIISKFSTRNPLTENKIKDLIKNDFNSITVGHEVSGKLNFYRRINTSYLNESIKNNFIVFSKYIDKAIKLLGINAKINILKADGGIMNLTNATNNVVETIFSGPSASLMGMLSLKKYCEDSILIDIGGTTTDIFFLADGIPLFEPLGIEINEYKTLVRSIFSKSLALGGNTAFIVANGILKIDPKKPNKPLALGGENITLSDAFNFLKSANIGDINQSINGLKKLSKSLNIDVLKTSKLIINTFVNLIKKEVNNLIKKINSKPIFTIKELLLNKQINPKNITITGAPALSLKPFFKDIFNLEIFVPNKYYDLSNALGSALAITTTEINLYANTYLGKLNIIEANEVLEIDKDFNLEDAKKIAFKYLEKEALKLGANPKELEYEITLAEEYNMVKGFYTSGKNIRVKAQVVPGLIKGVRFYD